MRVYACAREGVDIGIFTFRNPSIWIACRSEVSSHQNVHRKQHVILMKTTRHFMKNKHSFYRKQHVVLVKTSRRFGENITSFYRKVSIIGSKASKSNTDACINISIKRNFQAQNPRRCAENKRRDVEKQRKSNEDIAKQKRHLPPICLKKVY